MPSMARRLLDLRSGLTSPSPMLPTGQLLECISIMARPPDQASDSGSPGEVAEEAAEEEVETDTGTIEIETGATIMRTGIDMKEDLHPATMTEVLGRIECT